MSQVTSTDAAPHPIIQPGKKEDHLANTLPHSATVTNPAPTRGKDVVGNLPTNSGIATSVNHTPQGVGTMNHTTATAKETPANPIPKPVAKDTENRPQQGLTTQGTPMDGGQRIQYTAPQNTAVSASGCTNANMGTATNSGQQQASNLQPQKDKHSPVSKRKRPTKEEQQRLKSDIIRLLEAGYSAESILILLGKRKDCIVGCLFDLGVDKLTASSRHRHIMRKDSKLEKIPMIKDGADFWEAVQAGNGMILLTEVTLDEIRSSFNISR